MSDALPPAPALPVHYRRFFTLFLRFACIMLFVGLLMGLLFQESAKKTPFSAVLPAGVHLETVFNLSMVHGHAFLIGALIPMAMVWMLYLGLVLGHPPVSEKTLRLGARLYMPGAVVALLLMLYKGYHFLKGVQFWVGPAPVDFEMLNSQYFFGSYVLRALAYGLTHTALATGLGVILFGFWKTLKKQA